jgi:hypothetical protein
MSKHPAINCLYSYGSEAEKILMPIVSRVVGDTLKKTSETFDSMDMVGRKTFCELKRRGLTWHYRDAKIKKEGWLMPSNKVMRGWEELSKGKRVFFVYFWSKDKSLWVYEMKEGDFSASGDHFVPKGHYDTQLHVAIPQDRWCRVDVDLSGVVFEEDRCWID